MAERFHNHHILFHRKQHEATEDNKWIRRRTGLIVPLPLDIHDELHRNAPGVPPLDIYLARRVKGIIMREGIPSAPLIAIDNYCFAVSEATKSPKSHAVERAVGNIAIEAIRIQIPYIEAGTPEPDPFLLEVA